MEETEMAGFELARRSIYRPTAFRVRTLQPLGYISVFQKKQQYYIAVYEKYLYSIPHLKKYARKRAIFFIKNKISETKRQPPYGAAVFCYTFLVQKY